jgi:outer membrane immunogenic protein
MRKLTLGILTVAGLALGAQAATAADMNRVVRKAPAPAVVAAYNWSGFYLGGHVGYAWSSEDVSLNVDGDVFGTAPDPDGFLGGVQAGYNWQFDRWVVGVEGDWSWSGADGRAFGDALPIDVEQKWYALLTGRVGYAWDNWLWYVKGGAAWVDTDYKVVGTGLSAGETRSGWTIGGGVEWGFAQQWSAKLEYNYLDFGNEHYAGVVNVDPASLDIDTQVHLVKLGVNYRF